jgi:hypothetical protein
MWSSSARWAIPSEVPVDPSAPEARRWAEEELARAIYDQTPSLWDRFWEWVVRWFSDLLAGLPAGGSPLVPVLVLVALAAAVLITLAYGGRAQRRARAATSSELFDDARSAARLRADADEAARRGDWAAATLDRYRAIIRALDERVLLEDRPGLTASEAAQAAARAFPAHSDDFTHASRTFDAVRYGHVAATEADHARMRALDDAVARAQPAEVAT